MKRYSLFMVILSLILVFGLTQGCDKDNGEETTTPTTPTETTPTPTTPTPTTPTPTPTAAPTCSIIPVPQIVRHSETTKLIIYVTGGPANGSFSPSSGECGSLTNLSGNTSCTTAPLYPDGEKTFTLKVNNASGTSTCSTKVYVSCDTYRVWNNTGSTHAFKFKTSSFGEYCVGNVANGSEITDLDFARRIYKGDLIWRYYSASYCVGGVGVPNVLTFDDAMNSDSLATGGNGNCQVNFDGTDR